MAKASTIFTAAPIGVVARLPDGVRTATVALIKVTPADAGPKDTSQMLGSFQNHKAIITSWSFDENVNVQFTHTMGNDIYLNVFGNRMGTFTVNGIAFHSTAKAGGQVCDKTEHGITKIIKWYRDNRISNPAANRIKMTIGGVDTIDGFLIGASYRANDPVNWAVEYTMQIAAVPR